MNPLIPVPSTPPPWEQWLAEVQKRLIITDVAALREFYEREHVRVDAYANAIYRVARKEIAQGFTHLMIRRADWQPVKSWEDFQAIKNQLCGPEREAVELYPAESRLVDTGNVYHLWVLPEGKPVDIGYRIGRHVWE